MTGGEYLGRIVRYSALLRPSAPDDGHPDPPTRITVTGPCADYRAVHNGPHHHARWELLIPGYGWVRADYCEPVRPPWYRRLRP